MQSTILPVAGEASELLQELIAGGQPVVLVDPLGHPVAVVLDVESYEEVEEAAEAAA
jgi:PHD/YefM family antitoxin component YafN of YafNO toxin-antitoxin module